MSFIHRTVFAAVFLAPSLVFAQGTPPPPPAGEDAHPEFAKVREACRADVERLCKDVKPGGGRIRECLKAHAPDLSEGCKAAIAEARAHHHPRD